MGRDYVLEGRLRYIVERPLAHDELLQPGSTGAIVPAVHHRVEPDGEVRCFVEFYRRRV